MIMRSHTVTPQSIAGMTLVLAELCRNETQNDVHVQVFSFFSFFFFCCGNNFNSDNIAKELIYEPVFWMEGADKLFFLSDIT